MRSTGAHRLVPVLLILAAACLGAAPLVMPDGYSIVANTTSESAAQATQGAWLARTGFLLFGSAVLWLSVVSRRWQAASRLAHMTFGVAMVAAAVYSHRPFLEDLPFDRIEDLLHSIAATGMGLRSRSVLPSLHMDAGRGGCCSVTWRLSWPRSRSRSR